MIFPVEAGSLPEATFPEARIIDSSDHPILPSQIDPDALYILRKLSQAGHAGYLVGGGVRDLYLGKTPKDFDISTDARPGQLRKIFPRSRTIGRRFRLVQVFFKSGKTIEVSTLRSLSEHDLDGPEAVLAPNNTFGTLGEDAQRRDLTINSLFYKIENQTIIDYVGGCKDLENRTIRMVGNPPKRIGRDPVRMMRAIRHAARNGFDIEPDTWNSICNNAHKLSLCPPSRLRDEFFKDLYGGAVSPWFHLACESNLLYSLFPLYRKIFKTSDKAEQNRELMTKLLEVIDRINALCTDTAIHRQPDYFLLALFLIPWAENNFQLFSQQRKSSALHKISKTIREQLDSTLAQGLILRRSLRQDAITLLCTLPIFLQCDNNQNWPKWLKRKSYYSKTSLFHAFYREATTGELIPFSIIREENKQNASCIKRTRKNNSRSKYNPAFSPNAKGGVFGFKK